MSAQDPRFMQALARALAEMQGQDPQQAAAERGYQQDAARAQQQYGMFNDGSPNALQGGYIGGQPYMDSRYSPEQFRADRLADAGDGPRDMTYQYPGPGAQEEPFAPLAAEGIQGLGVEQSFVPPDRAQMEAMSKNMPKAKKKGEFSHFFQLLKQAKSEGKGGATSKAFKDLAKQLEKDSDPTAAQGGTIPVA